VLKDASGLIGDLIVKVLLGVEASEAKVGGKPLSKALEDYTLLNNQCWLGIPNLLGSMFFGERVVKMNFCESERQLGKNLDDIRAVVKQIINNKLT
jgi:hypothetical protein